MMTTHFERDPAPTVLRAIKKMPVVAITGLRQTGKTTFLQHQFPSKTRRFIFFDDFAQLSAAKSDLDRSVNCDEPLTIDEAHKCLEIFTAIKKSWIEKENQASFCFPYRPISLHLEEQRRIWPAVPFTFKCTPSAEGKLIDGSGSSLSWKGF
jgi:hypothetical protein